MISENEAQYTSNSTVDTDIETQGVTITNSTHITVRQVESQSLFVVQSALQAAVEAAIIVLGSDENNDVTQLQLLGNALATVHAGAQDITISGSNNVTVEQTEIQVDAVVQSAINLLAQLLAKTPYY